MFYAGKNILSSNEKLSKVSSDYLYNCIRNPKEEIKGIVHRLSLMRTIDESKYKQQKRLLPYFTTSCYNPPYRQKDNFAYIDHFILDIDEPQDTERTIMNTRTELMNDSRVMMLFQSQGCAGLKLIFRMKERCYDEGLYSVFVREFARRFFRRYNIKQFVTAAKADVSYACFISIDKDVYYNPEAEPVSVDDYIDREDPFDFFRLKKEQEEAERLYLKQQKDSEECKESDPCEDIMSQIKNVLSGKNKDKKSVCKMKSLDERETSGLVEFLENHDIIVSEVRDMYDAKKLVCRQGELISEVNIFKSSSGHCVIHSPKSSTSEELNDIVTEIAKAYLNEIR